ncbi:MAG: CBS domain-containing protein [Candidatus Nanopelagicales bacterium]|nr:CBS domain-containing protein [Candidatus Nanopelagicales bacterium]
MWHQWTEHRVLLSDIPTTLELIPKFTITPERTAHDAAALMSLHMTDALPVISDGGHLVGIITSADIVHWVAQ